MTVAFSLLLSFYCAFVVGILWGWRRVMIKHAVTGPPAYISIVVPFRNEVGNIKSLIGSLMSLGYPRDHWEVILVNDHSTDQSMEMAQSLISGHNNFLIHNLDVDQQGKKQALKAGISFSKFPIVATTDADCKVPFGWLRAISDCFQKEETKMTIGLVKLDWVGSLFGRMQTVELTSLIASTAAAIGWNHPIMCNGANLAFRKKTFLEVGGYEDNLAIASGDDEFLMRKIVKQFPGSAALLHSQDAVVVTGEQTSGWDFINQRIRWASKWRHNADALTQILAVVIVISQFSFVGLLLFAPIGHPVMIIVLVKIVLEGLLIYRASTYLRQNVYWVAFLLLQPIYPIYVLLIGVASFFVSPRWKNRKL